MSGLLVAGTTSDAGKSVVTTGLCRAFARRGVRVAPYKAQNMSNNSMVCAAADDAAPDGATDAAAEIGRAQWVQAQAARVTPEPAMNPVLLKPGSDRRSHVVLMGRPGGAVDAGDYVNMGLARHAGLPAVIVGDIDRGGVFAALFGTVALLEPADQALVTGFVVNKFRGDRGLLAPGLTMIERMTGRRVYGVLPWHAGLWLDSEDALDLEGRRAPAAGARRVAVVRLPRISNFTDLDALGLEPALDVVFASAPRDVTDADLLVLPGTRATIADLAWLRARGLDLATTFHAEKTLRLHPPSGYEIHHGRITGETRAGAVTGTMVHGSLEDDGTRAAYLAETLGVASAVSFPAARERRLDLLGDLVQEHLDVDRLLELAHSGAPAGLPVLPPGGGSQAASAWRTSAAG